MKRFILLAIISLMEKCLADGDNLASQCSRWYQVPASNLNIDCPPGHTVLVTKAVYGFWKDASESTHCSYTQGDCTEDAMHVAVSHCHGKTSCEIPVGISIVAHGLATILGVNKKCGAWHDRHDYMEVSYKCPKAARGATFVASDCTKIHTVNEAPHETLEGVLTPLRHNIKIQCPQDQQIRVKEAFYGWWKNNRDQGCRFHQDDCKETTTTADMCNGLTDCEVPIERSATSATCGGFELFTLQIDHHDYFQVNYQCLEEK